MLSEGEEARPTMHAIMQTSSSSIPTLPQTLSGKTFEVLPDTSLEAAPKLVYSQSKPVTHRDQTVIKCPTCFLLFPRLSIPAEWRSSFPNNSNFCSADCYSVMKVVHELPHDPADFFLCAFCRQWTHDPWMLDCTKHGVCSPTCGRLLIENTTKLLRDQPVCPECSESLTQATVMKFFDGGENITEEAKATELFFKAQRELQATKCKSCESMAAERIYICKHGYCSECFYLDAQGNDGLRKCPHPSGCEQVYFIKEGK